jgi:hypothetical protein
MDVECAFSHGHLSEEIFIEIPQGYSIENKNKVCRLNKALYGLKQGPKAWNERLNNFLTKLGFHQSTADYCLYVLKDNDVIMFILIYVDDFLLASNDSNLLSNVKKRLQTEFKMKDLGKVKQFLGSNVTYDNNGIIDAFDQSNVIVEVAKKFNVYDCKPTYTPIEVGLSLEVNVNIENNTKKPYKQLLGCLMYISLGTRPDIAFSVSFFGTFQQNPTDVHFKHLLRVLKYLMTTKDLKLKFRNSNVNIEAFADADWANCINTRRSVSGFCFNVFGSLVSWSSRKQSLVTLFSTEAEFVLLCNAACDLLFLRNLLNDMKMTCNESINIYEDNQSTIKILKNFENNKRCKHLDVKYHFIFDLVRKNVINVLYIPSENQPADILTKALCKSKILRCREMLNLL